MTSGFVSASKQPWWKESSVYQIYPASFLSTNPSPEDPKSVVGDIKGIIAKVPYIASLGFDSIWLSPIFESPQKDMGYDISNYRDIHDPYGTVEDVEELLKLLHSTEVTGSPGRTMRLLMDLVVNHTSDEHPWFLESCESKTGPKSDWYFWEDARYDDDGQRHEPNNWRSIFGGSAWHWIEARQQYYLALFLPNQPDLNWENPEMRAATYEDMRWWLDKGVDGFRIDSMNLMSKNPELPDAAIEQPHEKYQSGAEHYASGPRMHEFLQEISREVFAHYDIFTVGELGSSETEESVSNYVSATRKELNCVFHGMDMDFGAAGKYTSGDPFTVSKLREKTEKWQVAMPKFDGWNTIYLDNHDSGRSLSRYASDDPKFRVAAAKMLATYICTLSGTPFVLAGQEIGIANLGKDVGIEDYIDVEGQNWYKKIHAERKAKASSSGSDTAEVDMSDVMHHLQLKARDHGRLPMQWDSSANAGFCKDGFKPWMTVNPDYKDWNVEGQINDESSILGFWKKIMQLRKDEKDVFVYGTFKMLSAEEAGENVLGYERVSNGDDGGEVKKAVVLLSFEQKDVTVKTSKYAGWKKIIGNLDGDSPQKGADGGILLRPYEALILSES